MGGGRCGSAQRTGRALGGGEIQGRGSPVGLSVTAVPPRSRTELGGPRLQLTLWYHRDERKLVAIVHGCR